MVEQYTNGRHQPDMKRVREGFFLGFSGFAQALGELNPAYLQEHPLPHLMGEAQRRKLAGESTEGLEAYLLAGQALINALFPPNTRDVVVKATGNELFSTRELLGLGLRVKPGPVREPS